MFMKRIVLLVICFLIVSIVIAGEDNYPVGARSAALANSSVTLNDVWSTSQNQAGLGFVRNYCIGVNYENKFLMKELSIKAAACALPVRGGTFGLFASNYGYSLYNESKYALSFAKAFGEKLSIGVSMDYLNVRIGENYGQKNMLVAEFGIISKPLKNLTIGAHVYNPTRTKMVDYNHEYIPTIFRLGGNYSFSDKVLFLIETEKDISQNPVFKTGLEYKPIKQFFLRVGVSTNPTLSAFGFGVLLKSLQIDVSARYHQVLGFSSQLGLTYTHRKNQNTSTAEN